MTIEAIYEVMPYSSPIRAVFGVDLARYAMEGFTFCAVWAMNTTAVDALLVDALLSRGHDVGCCRASKPKTSTLTSGIVLMTDRGEVPVLCPPFTLHNSSEVLFGLHFAEQEKDSVESKLKLELLFSPSTGVCSRVSMFIEEGSTKTSPTRIRLTKKRSGS